MAAQAPYPAYGLAWFCRPDKRSAIRQFSGTVLIAGWRRTALSGLRFGWGV